MNLQVALALLGLIVLAQGMPTSSGGEEPDCAQFNIPICPRDYNPVCGTDGHQYSSECVLCDMISQNQTTAWIANRGPCPA